MPTAECTLDELRQAYQVLGVPLYSSSHSIKQAYRCLIKRWHPDLYATMTPAHAEATRMMELVNEAYSKIEHAPLRYYADSFAQVPGRGRTVERPPVYARSGTSSTIPPLDTDRIEFWVRFAHGAFLGVLIGIRLLLSLYEYPTILALSVAAAILGCGFSSARFGDRFWRVRFKRWWLWW
jgi:hypothetical protein